MKQQGFSLIEALVSIAILSMAAASVLVLMAEQSRTLSDMQNRALARIVADNALVSELSGESAGKDQPRGEVILNNTKFLWQRKVSPTEIAGIVEVTYTVTRETNPRILATATRLRQDQ